jgi:hypothetical protein
MPSLLLYCWLKPIHWTICIRYQLQHKHNHGMSSVLLPLLSHARVSPVLHVLCQVNMARLPLLYLNIPCCLMHVSRQSRARSRP